MIELVNQHESMRRLVDLGVVFPGVFQGKVGSITFYPISTEEYLRMFDAGQTKKLAYNTRTLGRGIFTIGTSGEIINFKGVDSHLTVSDSIAVTTIDGEVCNITGQDSYGIHVIHFRDKKRDEDGNKVETNRVEYRVKGASQYHNLLSEKLLNELISARDAQGIVKLPTLDYPVPFNSIRCENLDLPRVLKESIIFTEEDILQMDKKPQANQYLDLMRDFRVPIKKENENWMEYFSIHHDELLDDEQLMAVARNEDRKYVLGATFGQMRRQLENPFRIMELSYYLAQAENPEISEEERKKAHDSVDAILEYTTRRDKNYLHHFAQISAQNAAGFMNTLFAIDNFEHRQDYPLSGEICDDAFDDVSTIINGPGDEREKFYARHRFYTQVFVFATNVKIVADAFRATGRPVPTDIKRHFVEVFYDSLEDKMDFIECFANPNPMEHIRRIRNAEQNFAGMEEFLKELRAVALEIYKEHNVSGDLKPEDNRGIITLEEISKKINKEKGKWSKKKPM